MKKKNGPAPAPKPGPAKNPDKVPFIVELAKKKPLGLLGLIILIGFLLVAIFADQLAPYPMLNGVMQSSIIDKLQGPSAAHLLGTDNLGRDVLSYLIYGARTSAVLGICCTLLSVTISVLIGTLSATIGGWFDLIVQRIVDAVQCIPATLILLILMSMLGNGIPQMIFAMSVPGGITGSRMMRSAAISVKDSGYVKNSGLLGAGTMWKTFKHVVPNILPIIITNAASSLGGVILQESSLNFLGFGVDPGTPSWGYMITNQGKANMYLMPSLAVYPGVCIALMVFGATMFGDAVRDLLDPRLKGGVGTYNGKKLKKIAQKMSIKYHYTEPETQA
ncbi:MAG: ABC transporter permease [Oscillospiraceae bacterium]|nr:ABC transporter permease [Oscillospiraceae bacterium]